MNRALKLIKSDLSDEELKSLKFIYDYKVKYASFDQAWTHLAEHYVHSHYCNPETLNLISMPLLWYQKERKPIVYRFFKRLIDISLILLSLPLSVTLMLVIAIAVKLNSKGPVFFKHLGVGQFGIPFYAYKIRTMKLDAQYQRRKGRPLEKDLNDPRVTSVGRRLRKYYLDELPQIYNVICGEMSLVGPRPVGVDETITLPIRYYDRFIVKPGITGLWQATKKNIKNGNLKFAFDAFYVKRRSFLLDVFLLFLTIKNIFIRKL